VHSAIVNYVEGVDLSNTEQAMERIRPGTRVRVEFVAEPQGRVTDFFFVLSS